MFWLEYTWSCISRQHQLARNYREAKRGAPPYNEAREKFIRAFRTWFLKPEELSTFTGLEMSWLWNKAYFGLHMTRYQFAQVTIREKPLLISLHSRYYYKWFLQSVFHSWSIVTQDCTLCKLVGEAWNAIHELHLWVYFNYMNNQIADDYIQSKFVKRKTRDGVTSYEALALLYKCAISTYTCQHLYNKLQFPMIILFYNPRFLLQKSNLSSQQSYYFA